MTEHTKRLIKNIERASEKFLTEKITLIDLQKEVEGTFDAMEDKNISKILKNLDNELESIRFMFEEKDQYNEVKKAPEILELPTVFD